MKLITVHSALNFLKIQIYVQNKNLILVLTSKFKCRNYYDGNFFLRITKTS